MNKIFEKREVRKIYYAIVQESSTFGKALVQSVHSLADGSGLAVTIAHYYTPEGVDISSKGIDPDVQVALTARQRRRLAADPGLLATREDPQYNRAIKALETTIVTTRQNAISLVQ
ncbi:MAG: hypothetical protein F6K19_30175 [Cyanothece sp. SIO1E1]|nr:hypothetical protein [Cyanothece sp. SIO1E1]